MNKRFAAVAAAVLLLPVFNISVSAAEYNDVNPDHWAYESIIKAESYGFMSGMGDGMFGMGQTLKRSEFASLLVRMFGWNMASSSSPSFSDNTDSSKWYYGAVETAAAHGAVKVEDGVFRPDDNITREEIAVMLVRALGYDTLADSVKDTGNPFTDVTDNRGYITIAYDFGIISGKSETTFDPKGTALREEAAAMMVRAFDKYNSKMDWLHGFYAFSSWGQKELGGEMDGVSLGWSRMEYSEDGGVVLNTTSTGGNEWCVPLGYEDAVSYFENSGVPMNLDVYMSAGEDSAAVRAILTDDTLRQNAIDAIIEELTVDYRAAGHNFYSGVTIDFENLKGGEIREGFVKFLDGLRSELDGIGKDLYVAVQPPLKNSAEYFDGYDFAAIGGIADKIILMAHDYAPSKISSEIMESGFTTTPVTPFDEVYYALKTITNSVGDKSKIAVALSMSSAGWTVQNGVIVNNRAHSPSITEVGAMLDNGTAKRQYSEKYRNPYATYSDGIGDNIIWYEDAESVTDKIELARMFGVTGVSVWRLGIIPNSGSENMNVWTAIKS